MGFRGAEFAHDSKNPDGLLDVFEVLLTQIGELSSDLASDVIVDGRRDADAAGFCHAFQPRRDVDAVSKNVMGLDDDVADIDAHAKSDAVIFKVADC